MRKTPSRLPPFRLLPFRLIGVGSLAALLIAAQPADRPAGEIVYTDRAVTPLNLLSGSAPPLTSAFEVVKKDGQITLLREAGSTGPATHSLPHSAPLFAKAPPPAQPRNEVQERASCGGNLNLDLASLPAIPEAAPNRQPASLRGAEPTGQPNGQIISTLNSASDISDTARGMEIVQAATAARQALAQAAADDSRTLAAPYQAMNTDQLGEALKRAQGALSEAVGSLESATQGSLDSAERARFRNLYLNAADKTALGLDAIQQDAEESKQREGTLGGQSPFNGLLDQGSARTKDLNPLAKLPALGQIFGNRLPSAESATSNDALVNRLVMLNGLNPSDRTQTQGSLKLIQTATLKRPDGKITSLPIVHNGYVFGAQAAGTTDCSAFVSSALPADLRKARFTTLDFKQMWNYQHSGRFPNPPKYSPERAALVKASALSFAALDLEAGDALGVGDLLVHRIDSYPAGHIFIVRSYNPLNMIAEVIEASQSAGTVRVREFPLSLDPMTARNRYIRAGLVALRLKPTTNRGCKYAEHRPAAPGKGGGK